MHDSAMVYNDGDESAIESEIDTSVDSDDEYTADMAITQEQYNELFGESDDEAPVFSGF